MGHSIGRTALAQLQSLLRGFLQDGSLPFGSVLTVKDIVDLISQECRDRRAAFHPTGDAVYLLEPNPQ